MKKYYLNCLIEKVEYLWTRVLQLLELGAKLYVFQGLSLS